MTDNAFDIAARLIKQEVAAQNQRLDTRIADFRNEMASRGLLMSSMYVNKVERACAEATAERADFARTILLRCLQNTGVRYDASLARRLKEKLATYLPEHMDGLQYRVKEAVEQSGIQNLALGVRGLVHEARLAALERTGAEIDLFVESIKAEPIKPGYQAQNVFHIQHSTVGALQTGAHSIAHVNQTMTPQTQADLEKALRQLAEVLATIDTLPGHDKVEITDLVTEATAEIGKAKPNMSKLRSYLPTIGTAVVGLVEVAANAKPAYEALKTGASAIGVLLP